MNPYVDTPEGTFTATGLDLLAKPATTHVALEYTEPPRDPWWRRVLIWLGFAE